MIDMDAYTFPLFETHSIESDSTEEVSDKDSPLKPRWQCCSQDESEWLGSDVLITKNGRISSQSILGRYDNHFDMYPWYKGSRVFQYSRHVCTCDVEAIGFGFMTLDIPGVVDILKSTHIINGKEIAISRTIFVGDLPKAVNEDEFVRFFSKFGKVVEHYIVHFSKTRKSTDFGFIIFDSDKDAIDLVAMESIYFAGVVVKIKQAVFDKCTSPAPSDKYYSRTFCGDLGSHSGADSTDKEPYSTEEESDKDSPLKPIWPCCFQDESEWLGSDVLITKNGRISSQSILGRYDKHFDMYPWYKGASVSRRVFTCDREAIGFGFTTLDISGVVDILMSTHIINGKKVAISRTIFVGDLPKTVNEDEFEQFFSKFGKIVEHYIVRNSKTGKSAGFGFIIFESDKNAVGLATKEFIHFAGVAVKIKLAVFDKYTDPELFDDYYARTFCGDLGSHSSAYSTDIESDLTEEESDKDSPLKPKWPCCFQDESEWLGSDVLITKNGAVSSHSILGRYNKHFDMYPWYENSRILRDSRRVFTRDVEAIGFAFMTLDIPGVEDILNSAHIINGKKVAISRTIFVGDLPKNVNEDEFERFFSKFGKVVEHYIVRWSKTRKSAGFGFIIFDSDKDAIDLAAKESIHFAGVVVKIKQAAFDKCASSALFLVDYARNFCEDLGSHFGGGFGQVKCMIGAVGADAEDDRIELLLSEVEGKDITKLIASGREKFASVPSGGGAAIVVAAPAAGSGAAAPAAAAEAKKEEKVEEKEESDDVLKVLLA